MKKIGILYDNISRNTGDLAAGLSIKNILLNLKYNYNDFEELIPGKSNPQNYFPIIIGGGLLIRKKGDFFYDKFRLSGRHILNTVGIHGSPQDLDYLENYLYISVRSLGDRKKIDYLRKKVNVAPCTTITLKGIEIDIKIIKPAIGIHCFDRSDFNEINAIIGKLSKNFNVYLLPITHYNYDYEFLAKLFFHNEKKRIFLLPILSPLEILTIIGKFNYFISYSLHGAYFSYMQNVPFLLLNDLEKMKYFMEERNLNNYLFNDANDLIKKIDLLLNHEPDYSKLLIRDNKIVKNHIYKIKQLLPKRNFSFISKQISIKNKLKKQIINENYLIKKIVNKKLDKKDYTKYLKEEIIKVKNELIQKDQQIKNLTTQLQKIQSSKTYKIWQGYCRIMKKLGLKR